MQIISKIKKILISIGTVTIALPGKVLGTNADLSTLYGPPGEIVSTKTIATATWNIILDVLKIIMIPLILIIGLIIYWKKSKSQTKTKVIKSIIAVLITFGLIVLIAYTYIVNNII